MGQARGAVLCVVAVALAACAPSADRVVFVTNTALGVNGDTAAPSFSVAYDRTEGVLGPTNPDGSMPGVYGSIMSNSGLLSRAVRQVYATGQAAADLTGTAPAAAPAGAAPAQGKLGPVGFFGTQTVLGFKVGFTAAAGGPVPSSVTLGLKRQEFSVLPVTLMPDGSAAYPSTIASLDTTGAASDGTATLGLVQFFAAGKAAENLAANPGFRDQFARKVEQGTLERFDAETDSQARLSAAVLNCYVNLPAAQEPTAWQDALSRNILAGYPVTAVNSGLLAAPGSARFQNARSFYASGIYASDGSDPARAAALAVHQKVVCGAVPTSPAAG